jgi:hypothetical protein
MDRAVIENLLCIVMIFSVFGIVVGVYDLIERERKIKHSK